jgi:hypothetical protein
MEVTGMLFSEVYCAYFNAVAAIIKEAQAGEINEKIILQIISEKAFSESMLSLLPAIKNEEGLVMNKELQTPLKHLPQMPLTLLQKRWLKALLTDPRIKLFAVDAAELAEVEPLFDYADFVFFDRYADGDPYADAKYIQNFRTILTALQEKRWLRILYRTRLGDMRDERHIPYKLEYSAKDDKFRLETATAKGKFSVHINLARIEECALLRFYDENKFTHPRQRERSLTFILKDERNALDRVMLHFSDCRKETRRLDNTRYQVELCYEAKDETEMLIRILSFGPLLKVIAPASFIGLIKERLAMQENLNS